MNDKYKKIGMVIVTIIIFGLLGVWVYNQFIAEPKPNNLGTISSDNSTVKDNNDKNEQFNDTELDIDPIYTGSLDNNDNAYDNAEVFKPRGYTLDTTPVEATFANLNITAGVESANLPNDCSNMPLNIIIEANDKSVDKGFAINLISQTYGTIGTPEYSENIIDAMANNKANVFFRVKDSLTGYSTKYNTDDTEYFSFCISKEEPKDSNIKITFSIVGLDSGISYGFYDINVYYSSETKTYKFDSITETYTDEDIKEAILGKAEMYADFVSDLPKVPVDDYKVYSIDRILDDYLIKSNGWEVMNWNDIPSSEYPLYVAIVNFEEPNKSYLALYFNTDYAYLGYNIMYNIDPDELTANGY